MITKNVAFLLGAGASRGYGYPTGGELMGRLTCVADDQLYELEQTGIEREDAMLFGQRLADCGLYSVDAFLKKNPMFGRIAKIRIAQELSLSEYGAAREEGRTDSWVKYLFSRMDGGGIKAFPENKCSLLTLNYDRSLEVELTKMLASSYGVPWREAAAVVRQLNIIHLHGSIGPLPDDERLYGLRIGGADLQAAANGILVMGESGSDKEYALAQKFLEIAEVTIALGFGFHAEIVEKLGLKGPARVPNLPIYCSCQGLTQSEVNDVSMRFTPGRFYEIHRDSVTWNHRSREPGPAVDYLRANLDLLR